MQFGIVIYVQSVIILFIGMFQLLPLAFAVYYQSNDVMALLYSVGFCVVVSVVVFSCSRSYSKLERIRVKESFAIVSVGWVVASVFSCVPFVIHSYMLGYPEVGAISSFSDVLFEMVSGLTTTGSSILTDIEALPKGLLFWRSLTHWLGGMGIILLAVAIIPMLEIGGMELYQAEVPGPVSDKISPRISATARILWGVYILFTVVETALLSLGGMDFFDALCHSFGTVATGGFSTKNLSIGYYESVYIDAVVTLFMFLSGINFTLHYYCLKGKGLRRFFVYFKNEECVLYCLVIACVSLVIGLHTVNTHFYDSFGMALHFVVFQVVSVLTTTGYAIGIHGDSTFHFGVWSAFSQFLLIMLMIMGGSAGSTAGGVKTLRVLLLLKFLYNEMNKFLFRRRIRFIRMNGEVVQDKVILSVLGFLMLHLTVFALATLFMNYLEDNLTDSFTAVAATLNNVGPGLGRIGPDSNFASLTTPSKWIMIFCMLLGRLEIYSVIILFIPATWQKN